tara:strand:+ start:454 stop:975 length:522 start_codon:yes stop_codon:yes gene_type:complete
MGTITGAGFWGAVGLAGGAVVGALTDIDFDALAEDLDSFKLGANLMLSEEALNAPGAVMSEALEKIQAADPDFFPSKEHVASFNEAGEYVANLPPLTPEVLVNLSKDEAAIYTLIQTHPELVKEVMSGLDSIAVGSAVGGIAGAIGGGYAGNKMGKWVDSIGQPNTQPSQGRG